MTEPPFEDAISDIYGTLAEYVVLQLEEIDYYRRREIMAVPYGSTTALIDNGIDVSDTELLEAAVTLYEDEKIDYIDGKWVVTEWGKL